RGFPGVCCCVLHHRNPTKCSLAHFEPCDRTLRISINYRRSPTGKVPINGQATRNRTLATTAFHCCNGDYLSHGRPAFPLGLRTANHLQPMLPDSQSSFLQMTAVCMNICSFQPASEGAAVLDSSGGLIGACPRRMTRRRRP